MGGKAIGTGRSGYFPKLRDLLSSHQSVLIVSIDNVSSQQMHEIREELRGKAIVLMGKNTMVSLTSVLLGILLIYTFRFVGL